MAEVIIFCIRQWQFQNENPKLEPQFLDANMSLRCMLASRAANPWKTILGCLTESCKVFMRRCRDQDPTTIEYIFLIAVDLMQLVGWHRGWFCKGVDLLSMMERQGLLASSAGNAFSGFAAIACLIDLIATFGLLEKGSVQKTCGPQGVDGHGDFQQSAGKATEPLGGLRTDEL
jgi:hypothetical protein